MSTVESAALARTGVERPDKLSKNARLIVVTSLIGWTLANMDQSFFTWAYPDIQKQLGVSLTQVSYLYLGIFAVGWLSTFAVGPLLEIYGRKPIFQLTLLTTAVGSVLSAFATGVGVLFGGRITASAGAAAENFTSQVMNIEAVPARRKGMMVAVAQIGYPLGWFLSAVIALLFLNVIGWRGLFLVGLLPALFVLYLRVFVKEPDRSAELLRLRGEAKRQASMSGEELEAAATHIQTTYSINKQEAVRSPLAQIFFKDQRRTTIMLSLWFFATNIANAGATVYLPTIAGLRHISQSNIQLIGIITTALAVVGYLSCAYLGTKIGRRNAIAIYYGIGILVGLLVVYLGQGTLSFGLLYAIWWFFSYGIYGCAITYIMESFPTRVRGTGSNFVGQFVWLGFLVYSLVAARIIQAFGATSALLFAMVGVAVVALALLFTNRNVDPNLELEEIAI